MESIITVSSLLLTLVGVYTFFGIEKLKLLLIGQGESVVSKIEFFIAEKRNKKKREISDNDYLECGYLDKKDYLRMKNAISRKNIYGVEESLIHAAINELKQPIRSKYGYYKNVLPKFISSKKSMVILKIMAYICILILFGVIALSIISEIPKILFEISSLKILILIMLAISIIFTIVILTIALFKKVGFEKFKKKSCKELRQKNPKIDKLYNCWLTAKLYAIRRKVLNLKLCTPN